MQLFNLNRFNRPPNTENPDAVIQDNMSEDSVPSQPPAGINNQLGEATVINNTAVPQTRKAQWEK